MFEKPRAIVLKLVEHAWVFQGSECGATTCINWAAAVSETLQSHGSRLFGPGACWF